VQLGGHPEISTDRKRRFWMDDFYLEYWVTHGNKGQLIHGFQLNSELDAE
jgi:hypothetical protein